MAGYNAEIALVLSLREVIDFPSFQRIPAVFSNCSRTKYSPLDHRKIRGIDSRIEYPAIVPMPDTEYPVFCA